VEYPASKSRTRNIAFVIHADQLRTLAKILGEDTQTLEYTVKFSDYTSVNYEDVEEVIRQPNSDKRSIISLIVGPARHSEKSAFVNLKKSGMSTVEYTIKGTQRDVVYLSDKLDDWIASIRQWYSPAFSWENLFLYLGACILPAYLVYLEAQRYPYISAGRGLLLVSTSWIVTGFVEYYVFTQLFPHGTFATGHGEKRHQVLTFIRNTVLVGFGLSVIGSVIANWLTKRP
jgi:hypothetical protein